MEGIKKPLSRALSIALMMSVAFFGMLAITQAAYADAGWSVSVGGERFVVGDTVEASIVPGPGGEAPASVEWSWYKLDYSSASPGQKAQYVVIEGANGPEFVPEEVTLYSCVATDPVTNEIKGAGFSAQNWIIGDHEQYYFLGDDGTVTLEASVRGACSEVGNYLEYQWYQYVSGSDASEEIEGADGDSFVAEETGHYVLKVMEKKNGELVTSELSEFYVQDEPSIEFDTYDTWLLSGGTRDYPLAFVVPDESFEHTITIGVEGEDGLEPFGEDEYSYDPDEGILTLDADAIKEKLQNKDMIDEDGQAEIYYEFSIVKDGEEDSFASVDGYFNYEDTPSVLLVNDEKCWNTHPDGTINIYYVKEISNKNPHGDGYSVTNVVSNSNIVEVSGPSDNKWNCKALKEGEAELTVSYEKGGSVETVAFPVYVKTPIWFWDDPEDSPLYSVGDRNYSVEIDCPEGYGLDIAIGTDPDNLWGSTDTYVEYEKTEDDEALILHGAEIWNELGEKPGQFYLGLTLAKADNPEDVLDSRELTIDVCKPYITLDYDRDWLVPVGRTWEDISLQYYDNQDPYGEDYPINNLTSDVPEVLEISSEPDGDETMWNGEALKPGSVTLTAEFAREDSEGDYENLNEDFAVTVTNIDAGCDILGKRHVYPGQTIRYQAHAQDVSKDDEDAENVEYRWSVIRGGKYVDGGIAADEQDPSKATLTVKEITDLVDMDAELPDDIEVMVEVLDGDPTLKDPVVLARETSEVELLDPESTFYGITPVDTDINPVLLPVGESFTVSAREFYYDDGETKSREADLPDDYSMECVIMDDDDEGEGESPISIKPNDDGSFTVTRTGTGEAWIEATLSAEDPEYEDGMYEVDRCEYKMIPATLDDYWIGFEGYDFRDNSDGWIAFAKNNERPRITPQVRWDDCELSSEDYTLKIWKENEEQTGFTEDVTYDVMIDGFPIGNYRVTVTSEISGEEEMIEEYLTVYDRYSLDPFGPEITFEGDGEPMKWSEGPRHMRGYYRVLLTKEGGEPALDPDPQGPYVSIAGSPLEEGTDYDVVYVKDEDGTGPEDEEAAFETGTPYLAAEPGYQVCLIKGKGDYSGINGTVCFLVLDEDEMALAAAADVVTAMIDAIYDPDAEGTFEEKVIAAREAYDDLSKNNPNALKYLPADKDTQLLIAEFHAKVEALDPKNPDEDAIAAARAAYNAIPEYARDWMETQVAYNSLLAAEKALADAETAAQVADMISKLNAANPDADAVAAARAAYNKLSDDQKALIPAEALKKLTDAEKKVADKAAKDLADARAAAQVADMISKLNAANPDANAVAAARAAYNKLSSAQKALIPAGILKKLTAAEQKVSEAKKNKEIVDLPAVKITKVKKGKKSFTVKWKKPSNKKLKKLGSIQVQYSTTKNFSKNVVTKKVKKTKKQLKVKRLKSKKTYYVHIRAYKVINGKVHVSKWSKTKKVKVK